MNSSHSIFRLNSTCYIFITANGHIAMKDSNISVYCHIKHLITVINVVLDVASFTINNVSVIEYNDALTQRVVKYLLSNNTEVICMT